MFTREELLRRVLSLVPLILSLTVHEWAHAYSAFRLGDDTAARQGRMTLNPLPHIDLFGTLLCPLLGVPFGWAKPVPVNPVRFRRDVSMRVGMMITAAAGPFSNLALALLGTVLYGLLLRFDAVRYGSELGWFLERNFIGLNLLLFLFNLFPVPPLDGSRVVDGVVPYRFRGAWEQLTQYSWIGLLLVIYFGGSLLAAPLGWLSQSLQPILFAFAGR
jgi:Zn-dependent protease